MEQKLKQRICIEFCVKLQISATETFKMLNKAFPNDASKRTTVFEWHSRFKAGSISIEDDPRQGRPKFQRTNENVQKITDLIKENPRTTLLELEQDTGISKTTIGRIVTEDLKLKKTPAKFIPRFLTNEQKLCRLATCEDMMEMTRTDPEWKDKIITGDETWVYGYDPETKPQSAEWRVEEIPPTTKSPDSKSRSPLISSLRKNLCIDDLVDVVVIQSLTEEPVALQVGLYHVEGLPYEGIKQRIIESFTLTLHTPTVRPRVTRAPRISSLASGKVSIDMPNSASPGSPGSAGQKPGRPSISSPIGGKNSTKEESHK
ncbi:hypothetical protein LAZ67_8003825 [Cordylochernes scorpioides]|uniref:Mos1 transposase HTH domain-containing protein n=1 Tax=Cordylochernes scorpioides TaxID=51811 RepID=A0ABY6KRW8_9ARAC|nr:hypothetical protein LAZ67_8003825 [Cordylochernes scorpioides]